MHKDLKKCEHCNKLKSGDDVKEMAYGLYAQYSNICIDCYNKLEQMNEIKTIKA